jgi:hypothetical protein
VVVVVVGIGVAVVVLAVLNTMLHMLYLLGRIAWLLEMRALAALLETGTVAMALLRLLMPELLVALVVVVVEEALLAAAF